MAWITLSVLIILINYFIYLFLGMTKEVLTFENLIKYAVLLCTLTGFYYKQSSDIKDIKTEKRFQIEHLQYQLTELKDCCNEKRNGTERRLSHNNMSAIIPNSIELQDEN